MGDKKGVDFGSGQCICPRCGYKTKHVDRGVPCTQSKCPKCGSAMMGESCHANNRIGSVRMMNFKCRNCGLLMVLPERPNNCVKCGGSDIVREGWKRYSDKKDRSRLNEWKRDKEHESRRAES